MNGNIHDIEAQRARWRRHRKAQALVLDASDDFARGGLAAHADQLDLRVLILPMDPEDDAVALDADVLAWLREQRTSTYGGPPAAWGSQDRGTSDALVIYDDYGNGWLRYLALHRHGGIEIGVSKIAYPAGSQEIRVFPLRLIVGAAWNAADLQHGAVDRWGIEGPFEVNVAVRDTDGAVLGHFAEGWREPTQHPWDLRRCIEAHLLLRREVDNPIDAETYALALGDQLEQAFGTTHRRHLAHAGEYKDRFDPRFRLF